MLNFILKGLVFSDDRTVKPSTLCMGLNLFQLNAYHKCYKYSKYGMSSKLLSNTCDIQDFLHVNTWFHLVYGKCDNYTKIPQQLHFMVNRDSHTSCELAKQYLDCCGDMNEHMKLDMFILCLKLQGIRRKRFIGKMQLIHNLKQFQPDVTTSIYIGIYNSMRKFIEYIAVEYQITTVSKRKSVRKHANVYNKSGLYDEWESWTARRQNVYNSCIDWILKTKSNTPHRRGQAAFLRQYLWISCLDTSLYYFNEAEWNYIALVPHESSST